MKTEATNTTAALATTTATDSRARTRSWEAEIGGGRWWSWMLESGDGAGDGAGAIAELSGRSLVAAAHTRLSRPHHPHCTFTALERRKIYRRPWICTVSCSLPFPPLPQNRITPRESETQQHSMGPVRLNAPHADESKAIALYARSVYVHSPDFQSLFCSRRLALLRAERGVGVPSFAYSRYHWAKHRL